MRVRVNHLLEWITTAVGRSGYIGIALLMFAETVCPPIPSELIMPLAGLAAARGDLRIVPAVLAGMPVGAFMMYSALGSAIWSGSLATAGICSKTSTRPFVTI